MKHLPLLFVIFISLLFSNSYAQAPQYYNFNTGGTTNSFPFNIAAGKEIQLLLLPGDLNQPTPAPAGNITSVSFRMAANLGPNTYSNMLIKMGQTNIAVFDAGVWYTGPMDTVYYRASVSHSAVANDWLTITLDRPFAYNPAQGLVIDVQQCGAPGATGFSSVTNTLPGFRRNTSLVGSSCPFPWGQQSGAVNHVGVNISPGGAPKNFAMLLPTPGVNTNYVAIPHQASMVGFNNLTIEAWMKPGSTAGANTVLNKGGISFDYQLGVSTGGIPFFRNQGTIATSTGLVITAGIWTHLAATFDGSTVRFYKDGILASTVPLATQPGSSANEMRIGRGNADPGTGNLDEVRLWSVARTQGQIDSNRCRKYPAQFTNATGLKALWHMDSTFVDSVSGYNGTAMGTVGFDTVSFPMPGTGCSLVGIEPIGNSVPAEFSLKQNYPNPFNPTTRIEFTIPKGEYVELKLYDLLGKEIGILVQGPYEAGRYMFDFNAGNLSSGIYFYTITAGQFKDTKKMLLVK
jgi:hypothetical protein